MTTQQDKELTSEQINSIIAKYFPCWPEMAIRAQDAFAEILATSPQLPVAEQPTGQAMCSHCGGEGVMHTGVCESPTTQCRKCDGTGLAAPHSPVAQMGGDAWYEGATFALRQISMLGRLHFVTDWMKIKAIETVTTAVISERDRLASQASNAVQDAPAAWIHEEDSNRVISAAQKEQALRDGGASASSVKPYSIAAVVPAATVPQVVQAPIPEILFDGYAVYSELTEKERADVVPKSVANVLDAIVRIMRRNGAAPAAIDVRNSEEEVRKLMISDASGYNAAGDKLGWMGVAIWAYEHAIRALQSPPQTGKEVES